MNEKLIKEMNKAENYLVVVEGKKDKRALEALGFMNIFVINETGKSLGEKIEQIQEMCGKKDKVCILTDFDKKGKQLYLLLKSKLSEIGVRMDNSLRGVLLKERISHIEGLHKHLFNQENGKNKSKKYK
jgi:5S rRNA maturation endonuclease (ribonuclease M5)